MDRAAAEPRAAAEAEEQQEIQAERAREQAVATITELLQELTGQRYTEPEVERMIHSVNNDGDDILTAAEYVSARCPFQPKEPPELSSQTLRWHEANAEWFLGEIGESCDMVCANEAMDCTDGEWGVVDWPSCRQSLEDANEDYTSFPVKHIGIMHKELPAFPLPLLAQQGTSSHACYATTATSFW